MVRNVKTLEGKKYSTRKIRKIIVEEEDSESLISKNKILKEKNRISAQSSRDNKKKFVVNLELRVAELEKENFRLKERLQENDRIIKYYEQKLEYGNIHVPHSQIPPPVIKNERQLSEQTNSEGDDFERLSHRSYISCGNFLMLALVVICCICGFLQASGETSMTRNFYDMKNINRIGERVKTSAEQAPKIPNNQRAFSNLFFPDQQQPNEYRFNYSESNDKSTETEIGKSERIQQE